jgi:RNA polymerase primary sigma factor
VMYLAQKYRNQGMEYLDLIQEGNIGLMRAAELFDPNNEKGANFGTYAKLWINSCMSKAIHRQGRTIMVPIDKSIQIQKLNSLERGYMNQTGNKIPQEELKKAMKMTLEEIDELRSSAWGTLSLSGIAGTDDNSSLEGVISDTTAPSVEEIAINSKVHESLMDELEKMLANSQLSAEERTVIWMHYIEDQTIETISETMSQSTRYVRYTAKRGLKKLQNQFNDDQEQADYFQNMLTAVRHG